MTNKAQSILESILFGSKWLLIPIYLGLMVGLGVYVYTDTLEVMHMAHRGLILTTQDSMLILLELVDMAMIANLVKMVITGSYTSFVNKNHKENTERVSSGLLKVKMSTSLVGVSSFHLLQIFIEAKSISWDVLHKQLAIHAAFLIGSLVLAIIEYMHVKGEVLEHAAEQHTGTKRTNKLHNNSTTPELLHEAH
jgi:uncharacterized protein (TIGR00645 family)